MGFGGAWRITQAAYRARGTLWMGCKPIAGNTDHLAKITILTAGVWTMGNTEQGYNLNPRAWMYDAVLLSTTLQNDNLSYRNSQ